MIDDHPLANQTITVFIDSRPVGDVRTDTIGFYKYSNGTNTIPVGGHLVYTRFISADAEWRSIASPTIRIYIVASTFSTVLFLEFFVLILVMIILVYVYFRRRTPSPVPQKPYPSAALDHHSHVPSTPLPTDSRAFLVDTASESLKDAVINRYQLLIKLLLSKGLVIRPGFTHRDLNMSMITQRLPRNATESITQGFEHARYAPDPIHEEDVTVFNINVTILLQQYGVT